MMRRGWWRPGRSHLARWLAWGLSLLMAVETVACAGSTRVIPRQARVSLISPWRYYDLWQALRLGRGVLVGTKDGALISGKFLSGGAKTVQVNTASGPRTVPITDIRYLINVIDLSHGRDGAIAGGVIGLGTGLALAYATGGMAQQARTKPARTAFPANARLARALYDGDEESSSGESTATGTSESTNSESSTNTTTSASSTEAGESSQSNAAVGAEGASSESSGASTSPSDPTEAGSNTYEETASSGGSSVAGGTGGGEPSPTTQQSGQSSGNSTVIVNVGATDGSNSRSSAGSQDNGQPAGGSNLSPVWRAFYYAVGFAAIGSFFGWAIGRTKKKAVPRVDYVLFPANLKDQGDRSPDQYLADQIAVPSGEFPAETLLPGSRFDSPRSAMLFEQFAHGGTVVRVASGVAAVITEAEAHAYNLFPTVRNFTQATIVSCGASAEPGGAECRYLAVVTSGGSQAPTVSLQRLSPHDVIRLGTQVSLIQAGIIH